MGPKVADMVASKELKVAVHFPKLEASPSAAKPLVVAKKKSTPAKLLKTAAVAPLAKKRVLKRKDRKSVV